MKIKAIITLTGMLFFTLTWSYAQQTATYHDPEKSYKLAAELFRKEKYSAAREMFAQFLENSNGASEESKSNARFYMALCAGELYHPEANNEIKSFIDENPESLRSDIASFNAGKIFYRDRKFKSALEYFESTDISYLNNDEIPEYWFKSGYSYFRLKDYDNANRCFHEILNINSKYQTAATYYYGHVAYQQNNLNTAIETFDKLKDSESFKPVLPYYYVQIYYEQGKYKEVIIYADELGELEGIKNSTEIKRYVAEAQYKLGNYEKALEMLTAFEENYPRLSREDYYQLGYCSYMTGKYPEAISYFEKVINIKDELQQTAYYNLADCFLKSQNKQSARNAFQFASTAEYNEKISEESHFNYAKLSFELGFQPVAINSLNNFTTRFPQSKHVDEANEILAQLYITTRNYKDALVALDKIKEKSPRARAAYQKVAYFRGIEFYNDRDYDKAIGLFTNAIVTEIDPTVRAMAMYWKAEAFYNQENYEQALKQYRIYLFNPASTNTEMYHKANYNLGYCHFKLNNYAEANTWFRKYILKKEATDPARLADAQIRIGDGFFMLKEYGSASSYYNDAISNKAKATDYCLFQIGMIQGIKGDMKGKSASMDKLINNHPSSTYNDDALFEKGNALLALEDYNGSEDMFEAVIKKYSRSEYAKKALLKTALIQYNLRNDEKALRIYKDVVEKYPSTTESTEALTGIRNIYVSMGQPQDYFDYVKNVSSIDVSTGAQDSITYEAAEQLYLKGDFKSAAKGFADYIQKFQKGYYRLNASFYKAECDYRAGDFEKALESYRVVIDYPRNIFTEKALLKAAEILINKNNCPDAIADFKRLEEIADFRDNIIASQTGQMRCYYDMKDYDSAIMYAQKLISGDKVSATIVNEAHLIHGRSTFMLKDLTKSFSEFSLVAKNSSGEATAEAKYYLALIHFMNGKHKDSQDQCFKVVNQVPSYEYWIGKSFILLGDNYLALKDTFQAKHTYKSIIDNYEGQKNDKEDLISIAQGKYNALIELENANRQAIIQKKEEEYFKAEGDTTETILDTNE